jgi:hypothetical protein
MKCTLNRFLLLLTLCTCASAQQASVLWRTPVPSPTSSYNPSVVNFIDAPASGGWIVVGNQSVNEQLSFIANFRLSQDLSDVSSRAPAFGVFAAGYQRTRFPDGALLEKLNLGSSCTLHKMDNAELSTLWFQRIKDFNCLWLSGLSERFFFAASENRVFKFSEGGLHLGDFSVRFDFTDRSTLAGIAAARGSNSGGFFLQFAAPTGGDNTQRNSVAFFDSFGIERWRYSHNTAIRKILATKDGGVLLQGASVIRRITLDGRPDWQIPASGTGLPLSIEATPDDQFLLLDCSPHCAIQKINAEGVPSWRQATDLGDLHAKPLLISAGGYAVVSQFAINVFSIDGEKRFARTFDGPIVAAGLSHDASQVLLKVRAQPGLLTVQNGATPIVVSPQLTTRYIDRSAFAGPDGSSYVLIGQSFSSQAEAMAFAPNGQLRWRKTLNTPAKILGASADRACFLNAGRVNCYSTDGRLQMASNFIPALPATLNTALWVNDQRVNFPGFASGNWPVQINHDSLLIVDRDRQLITIDNDGGVLQSLSVPSDFAKFVQTAAGVAGTRATANGTDLVSLDNRMQTLWRTTIPNRASVTQLVRVSDHLLALSAPASTRRALDFISPQGRLLWHSELPEDVEGLPGVIVHDDTRANENALYVLTVVYPSRTLITKLDRNTGKVLWSNSSKLTGQSKLVLPQTPYLGRYQVQLQTETLQSQELEILYPSPYGIDQLEFFDAESGALIDTQTIGRLDGVSFLKRFAFDDRWLELSDNAINVTTTLAKQAFQPRPALALAAPRRSGVWHNPAVPGQGFFIEQIGNTHFLAWFHAQQSEPSIFFNAALQQRWLTLQGDADPNANVVALKIFRTGGGAFPYGSAKAPVEVGTASLSFHSCNAATLRYEIRDPSSPMSADFEKGSIPLTSLVPSAGCLEQGDTTPISPMSGLFSQANVFGQGLVTVSGKAAFFAGWFVSDPAGSQDDPLRQAWFTLQASPIPAGSNRVSAKIYRTIGRNRNSQLASISGEVGSAEIEFTRCDQLKIHYRFNADASAALFAGAEDTLTMARVGACR